MTAATHVVLGVDIGTYESKGVLVTPDGAVIAQHRRPHKVEVPAPGHVEHDAETVWWGDFVAITKALIADSKVAPEAVKAVAVSGIGPCVLPIDADGNPLRNAILYGVDARADEQIQMLNEALGAEDILNRAGTSLTSQSAGPKVLWIEQVEPEVFAKTERFVTCQTFIVGRLTDEWVIDHATGAYYHPFYDRNSASWNLDGLPSALRVEQLPALAWSSDVAGTITKAASTATGLPVGIPVLVGAPDAVTEALSAGVAAPGDMMVMYGSSHFIIEVVAEPHSSEQLWPAPFLFPDSFLVAAGTSTAGSFTRWFADLVGAGEGGTDELYSQLASEAEQSPPGARGLLALPYLSGERTPLYDAGARGAFLGLTMQHNRGDMSRAIAEGIAQSVAAALDQYEREDLAPVRIRAVGGGTKNTVWLQAVTDISGHEQEVVPGLGASYGNAMLAAIVAGFLDGPDSIHEWVTPTATIRPRREFAALYDVQRKAFTQLYTATRPIITTLETLSTLIEKETA